MKSTKQHIVPVFYLKNFVNDRGKLFCKNKEKNYSFWASPENVCCEKNHYETLNEAYKADNRVPKYILQGTTENEFSKYEDLFSKTLASIIKKVPLNSNNKALICNKNELCFLSKMIANFITRNPRTIEQSVLDDECNRIVQTEDAKQLSDVISLLGFGKIEPYIKFAQKRDLYGIETEKSTVNVMANSLQQLNYHFAYTKKKFITSDCPVIYNIDEEKGLFKISLALSPHVLVEFSDNSETRSLRNKAAPLKDAYVDIVNAQQQSYELSKLLIAQETF